MTTYRDFLQTKRLVTRHVGRAVGPADIHPLLFPFQRDLTAWAIRKGRAAIFADTGLGKTYMQLEWARLIGETTLIVAPLSVARQTVRLSANIGVPVRYVRHGEELGGPGIYITNYEMVQEFDAARFGAVVLDESSILKALDGKTRQKLTDMFGDTPYRLCCTATPAPNDIAEIANHAEFLGVMSRADMLASFFVHDDTVWRLKGHAEDNFYRWLASWSMSVRKPSDLGYADDEFLLPPLTVLPLIVKTGYQPDDQLFFTGLDGIRDRLRVRRATIGQRVAATVELINGSQDQWLLWCGLNDEGHQVARLIPDAVLVEGSQSLEEKIAGIEAFQDGRARVMVTKSKIAGFGMNFQNCHHMAFIGLSDSWEAYYQCIRRCWRFGQQYPVDVHIVIAEEEQEIYQNIMRKEAQANRMSDKLIEHIQVFERNELVNLDTGWTHEIDTIHDDAGWMMMLGDSSERLAELSAESVDLTVFSPPFMSLYTYSPTERDLGNSRTPDEFFAHFGYIIDQLLRVTKPGRNCCVHASDIPAMLVRDGYIGLKDFPGMTIAAFEAHGWTYHGRVAIDKNPQAQAIRTHSKALLFNQLRKDASWSRPALADYILIFRKPGDNAMPVRPDITNEQWIQWAHPIWYGIEESDTLQYTTATESKDERHICPLQLGTIERCVRLWSNPGETILSPFAGIGSEGYVSIKRGRRFIGIELKRSYYAIAVENLKQASMAQLSLFAIAEGAAV